MIPEIFIINRKDRIDRLEAMKFELRGLPFTCVEASLPESEDVKAFTKQMDSNTVRHEGSTKLNDCTKSVSHLTTLKIMIDEGVDEAIICEDDIILRHDFIEQYNKIRPNFPEDADVVYFTTLSKTDGFGNNNKKYADSNNTIIEHTDVIVWGAQMYWISRHFALKVMHVFGSNTACRNLRHKDIHTPELFSTITIPYHSYLMLAVEDPVNISDFRTSRNIANHLPCGMFNYGVGILWRLAVIARGRFPKFRKRIDKLMDEVEDEVIPNYWKDVRSVELTPIYVD